MVNCWSNDVACKDDFQMWTVPIITIKYTKKELFDTKNEQCKSIPITGIDHFGGNDARKALLGNWSNAPDGDSAGRMLNTGGRDGRQRDGNREDGLVAGPGG